MESGVELQISYEEYKDFKNGHPVGHGIRELHIILFYVF